MAESSCFNYQETIIEGFICPVCLKSFGRAALLEEHFSKQHFVTTPAPPSGISSNVKPPVLGKFFLLTALVITPFG